MSTWLTDGTAFESLFTSSPNGIVALDAAGKIVDCNPAGTRLSGFSCDELIGRDIRQMAGPALRSFVEDAFEAAKRTQTVHRELDMLRRDGSALYGDVVSIPVSGPSSAVALFLVVMDLTERQKAQRSAANLRRDLQAVVRHMPTPAVVFDSEQTILDVNDAALSIGGFAREQCLGRKLSDFVQGDDVAAVSEQFERTLAGEVTRMRVRSRDSAGNELFFDATHVPMYEGDSIAGVFSMLEHVTLESKTENDLAQLQETFEMLFEHNPLVVLAVGMDRAITEVNPAGLRLSGYRRDEVIGRSVFDFALPSQRDKLRTFLDRAFRGEPVAFEIDAFAADGRLIEYEATALPIISNHRVVGIYGLLENIGERLRAERTIAAQREELIDLEHDFRALFERNPEGMSLLSMDGTVVDMNRSALRLGSYPREHVIGQSFSMFLQGEDLERGWSFFRRAAEGHPVNFETPWLRGDGKIIVVDVTLFPRYAQGLVVGIYCIIQDITERKIAQRKLEMQAQRMRDLYLLATTPEYTDAQVMSTLQTGCRLLGMASGAIVDTTGGGAKLDMRYDALELFGGDDEQLLQLARQFLDSGEPVVSSIDERDPSGYATWIACRLTVGGALQGILVFFSHAPREQEFEEIDRDTLALMSALVGAALERRRTRSHLRTLAYYDALTSLPNRLHFQEQLRDALVEDGGYGKGLAVLFFDLDRFKDINDSLGHAMGDRFLQMVANRLTRAVGGAGLVARMGGDEFIVLVREAQSAAQVEALAERLVNAIDQPYKIESYEQFLTTSVGISMYPGDGRDDQTLIKNADIAMYRAKERGGNNFCMYDEALEAPLRMRLLQEKDLRRALDRQEFVLHFQPIVDVATERIVCVEALVRWKHPQRGLVSPDSFIPAAEASGLIVPLGEWVIATGAREVREWHDRIGPVSLAVNISARQFTQPDLCDRLHQLLRECDLHPRFVEVEITESMALSDVTHSIETVRALKGIGAKIAVDDFGTGHSSLNYLRRFDVDHIKIDRSFVAGIGLELSDETIVKAIIAMGHSLGLLIVAEGVETREQYEFLKSHGCDRVQGYYFSRPLEAKAVQQLLESRGTSAEGG